MGHKGHPLTVLLIWQDEQIMSDKEVASNEEI